jgi:carbon storage regulator
VLALELVDVANRDLQLMGDPRVGPALPDPGPDLVELRFERAARHAARNTTNAPLDQSGEPCLSLRTGEEHGGDRGSMLVLTRKSNQSIMIGDEIEVSVLAIMGEKVRIGIQAPRTIPVFRKEVYLEIQQERGEDPQAKQAVDAALDKLKG